MELGVPAVSLETGLVRYFNETTEPDVLFNGILASGTLVPLVPPVVIGKERFMDGGVRANLPILHALHRGADRIVALLLNPMDLQRPAQYPEPDQPDQFRGRLSFLLDVFYDAEFMDDAREACWHYPRAEIMAYIPPKVIGSLLDFNQVSIAEFLERGDSEVHLVKDFCAELNLERGPMPSYFVFSFGILFTIVLLGMCRLTVYAARTCRPSWMKTFKAKVETDDDLELCDIMGRA